MPVAERPPHTTNNLTPPPSPSPRQRLWRNHPQSPAGNSAVRCVVNCQARNRQRAGGTRVGVLFRILTGIFVLVLVLVLGPTASITSTSTISLSTRTTEPTHRCVGCRSILRCGDHAFALITEDLERFVQDRSRIGRSSGKDRAVANDTTFMILDLWLWDAHSIHFPIDVLPS